MRDEHVASCKETLEIEWIHLRLRELQRRLYILEANGERAPFRRIAVASAMIRNSNRTRNTPH